MDHEVLTMEEAVSRARSARGPAVTQVMDTYGTLGTTISHDVVLRGCAGSKCLVEVMFEDGLNRRKPVRSYFYKLIKLDPDVITGEVGRLMTGDVNGWSLNYVWTDDGADETNFDSAEYEDDKCFNPVMAIAAWYAFDCGRDVKPMLIDHAVDVFALSSGLGQITRYMRFVVGQDEYMILSCDVNGVRKTMLLRASVADVDGSIDYWLYRLMDDDDRLLGMVTGGPIFDGRVLGYGDYEFFVCKGTARPDQTHDLFRWFGEAVANHWTTGKASW